MKKTRILYLAHYAPDETGIFPLYDSIHETYAQYHKRIYEILNDNCDQLMSSNNPSIMLNLPSNTDYIFSLYNRIDFRNSEIFVSALAEYHKRGYLGATPNIRALAEDKHLAKMLAIYAKIPTPKWKIYNIGDSITLPEFDGPYFVKPRFGAASKYIDQNSLCFNWLEAQKQILFLYNKKQDVILEEFIDGIYHTSPVLNNFKSHILLPCIEQVSDNKGNVVTFSQKRKLVGGLTRNVLKDDTITNKIHEYSKKMFDLIQPLDYTRFDYIVEKHTHIPYFIEFNVCCNLGEHSTLSQAAKAQGYSYEETILNILGSSLYRQGLSTDLSYQF